jgi:ADP-ribose pyrophosphatase YjhB (NUDIX family)
VTQPILVGANGRRFAGFAAAVLVFIIDADRRVLLLRGPGRGRGGEIVNGGLEAGETLLDGVVREVAEEAGPDVRIRVLGTVHAMTWHYDEQIPHMISTFFVAEYLGGPIEPGDDMVGSEVRWATLEEVRALVAAGEATVPGELWLFERAFRCFDLGPVAEL